MPQAVVELALSGIAPDLLSLPDPTGILRRHLTLDLFDAPQRERIRPEAVRLAALGHEQRAIAQSLWVEQTAVWRAIRLDRQMKELGLSSPYLHVATPPADYTKLRRHQHPRYRFDPFQGYPLP
jgi:hypothetical protein